MRPLRPLGPLRPLAPLGPLGPLGAVGSACARVQVPDFPPYLTPWGGGPGSQRAAARPLAGEIAITATLPISIPPLLTLGSGERRAARSETRPPHEP